MATGVPTVPPLTVNVVPELFLQTSGPNVAVLLIILLPLSKVTLGLLLASIYKPPPFVAVLFSILEFPFIVSVPPIK